MCRKKEGTRVEENEKRDKGKQKEKKR